MRLDQALVARGVLASRARAQAAISDGLVAVNGVVVTKAARRVGADDAVALVGEPLRWVSRAALKLEHGLGVFGVDPAGRVALDLGASTGGFSQVLLAHGAAHVVAVDVGQGQMDPALLGEERLTRLDGVNARDLADHAIPAPSLIVCDLSFISLRKALPAALSMAQARAEIVALVKPQFELEPGDIGKGGIVRDAAARARALAAVAAFLEECGWPVAGTCESPITGGDGNVEFLIHARKG